MACSVLMYANIFSSQFQPLFGLPRDTLFVECFWRLSLHSRGFVSWLYTTIRHSRSFIKHCFQSRNRSYTPFNSPYKHLSWNTPQMKYSTWHEILHDMTWHHMTWNTPQMITERRSRFHSPIGWTFIKLWSLLLKEEFDWKRSTNYCSALFSSITLSFVFAFKKGNGDICQPKTITNFLQFSLV